MATKGKRLRFEREMLLLCQARAQGVGVFLRGHPAPDEVARELVTLHSGLFAGLSRKSAGDRLNLLLEQHRKSEKWSTKQSGTNEQSDTPNTGLFIQLIKANWNRGRETSCSVLQSACEKKKFFFVQIYVFVRGQKSSELIQLLLDKAMAHSQLRNRQTNPPNRPTKCKTVFVDSIFIEPGLIKIRF